MATLDEFDRERRQKNKKKAQSKSFAVFLLKAIFAGMPVVTKMVQLAILIKDNFR